MRLASAVLLLALTPPAQAQQANQKIVLSCNGTEQSMEVATADEKTKPITGLGIIVNLSERTVAFEGYVTPITDLTPTLVTFIGQQAPVVYGEKLPPFNIEGTIDRVTGVARIGWVYKQSRNNAQWELTCRPATRLF